MVAQPSKYKKERNIHKYIPLLFMRINEAKIKMKMEVVIF